MSKSLSVLLTVIILIILGAVGYYFLNQRHQNQITELNNKVTELETKISTAEEALSSDTSETADWKTYTNDNYGFSLKYPTTWKIYEEKELDESAWNLNEKMRFVISDNCNSANCELITFSVYKNGVMENLLNDYRIGEDSSPVSISNKIWSKRIAPKDKRSCMGAGCVTTDQHVLFYKSIENTYVISYNFLDDTNQAIVNKILSTFKFTN